MSAAVLLRELAARGVRLTVRGDRLVVSAPEGALRPEEVERVRAAKADLIAILTADRPPTALRRCGAMVCPACHALSPSPHRPGCAFPRFEPCRSRWFWLSPYRAVKCAACEPPADLALVEGWVLARETGEGDGFGIPGEILSLLRVHADAREQRQNFEDVE